MMDANLKTKWVEALRSGEYKQGTEYLLNRCNGTYCCLGVLCVVYGIPNDRISMNMTTTLPMDIDGLSEDVCSHLGDTMNDYQGKTFAEIADYIEANISADQTLAPGEG
jgi:hypothetical protein